MRSSSLPAAVLRVFPRAVRLADFYPYWDSVEVEDAGVAARTLAFDVMQQLVCADAQRVHGNASADFVRAICRWRLGGLFQPTTSVIADDVCASLSAAEAATRRALFGQQELSQRRTRSFSMPRTGQ